MLDHALESAICAAIKADHELGGLLSGVGEPDAGNSPRRIAPHLPGLLGSIANLVAASRQIKGNRLSSPRIGYIIPTSLFLLAEEVFEVPKLAGGSVRR